MEAVRRPENLGTRESRGFKAECHPFPVFPVPGSGRDHQLLHSLSWYQMTSVNEYPQRNQAQCSTCTTHGLRSCLTFIIITSKSLQMCRVSQRRRDGTRSCWTDDHAHDYDCSNAQQAEFKGADPRAATPMREQPQQPHSELQRCCRSSSRGASHPCRSRPIHSRVPLSVPTTFDLLHPCLQEETPRCQPCLHR